MPDAPFAVVDQAVHASMAEWTPVTDILSPVNILDTEKSFDLEMREDLAGIGTVISILPRPFKIEHRSNATKTKGILSYQVKLMSSDANLTTLRLLESKMLGGLMNLCDLKDYAGSLLSAPTPWVYENANVVDVTSVFKNHQWQSTFRVDISLSGATEDVIGAPSLATPAPESATIDGTVYRILTINFDAPLDTTEYFLDVSAWTVCVMDGSPTGSATILMAVVADSTTVKLALHVTGAAAPCLSRALSYSGVGDEGPYLYGANGTAVEAFSDFSYS